jgi:hypothetical protein
MRPSLETSGRPDGLNWPNSKLHEALAEVKPDRSKRWLKIKNPDSPPARRADEGTF